MSWLGETDLRLIEEGRHHRLWNQLGAHPRDGGVSFAVWAPRARAVRAVVDRHDGRRAECALDPVVASGIWAGFLPGAGAGSRYRYEVLGADGRWRRKADPLAQQVVPAPDWAGVVVGRSSYRWRDEAWRRRSVTAHPARRPMSVYEVHLASWRPGLSYVDLAEQLTAYVAQLGFTHVEFLPVTAHPYGGSWGYQVTGYYAPDPRLGTPDDFRLLVDRLHQAGIAIILDWVPGHFPKDDWALARFDGGHTYEHPDPRRGEHPDWGTAVFDLSRPQVRNFLVASALYWLAEYHIDGLRVDAVASMLYLDYSRPEGQWLPNELGGRENLDAVAFLRELTTTVHREHPDALVIAEESTAWPGVTGAADHDGLGFDFKWNLGWMHDTLGYLGQEPGDRPGERPGLTFPSTYAWSEHFVLPISHDEVVHGKGSLVAKMTGSPQRQRADARALLAYMWAHPGKKLLFMGCELGQRSEWSEERGLPWGEVDGAVTALVRELNRLYRRIPALWSRDDSPTSFGWIDATGPDDTASFARYGDGDSVLVCLVNFSSHDLTDYVVGLPRSGAWRVVLDTNSGSYGGWGTSDATDVDAAGPPRDGQPHSAVVMLPGHSAIWLTPADPDPIAGSA